MRLSNPLGSNLAFILVLGTQLLALTDDGGRMFVWDTSEGGEYACSHTRRVHSWFRAALEGTVQFDAGFTATSILHPATYLNKVLIASSEGNVQLWNIRSRYALREPDQPSLNLS